jgi:predicted dehydrogenase
VLARVNHTAFYNPSHHEWGAWRTHREISGGGVLMDLGSHRIDLLIHLLGDIQSACGYAEQVQFPFPVDDSAVFTLRFESGVHAVANMNWSIGVSVDEIEIYGTKGCLRCSPLNSGNLVLQTRENSEELNQPPLPYTHTGLIEDFVNHLKTGEPICCSGEEGLKTNVVIADIYAHTAR